MRIAVQRARVRPINLRRAGILAVAFGGIAVWLVAASTEAPARPLSPAHAAKGRTPLEITRLHQPVRSAAAPIHVRDPFRYATQASGTVPPAKPASASASPAPVVLPAPALFSLAGLAEDHGANGPVRTAIISGPGELFLVKEGEAVTPRYVVTTISSDRVALTDVGTGTEMHLALK